MGKDGLLHGGGKSFILAFPGHSDPVLDMDAVIVHLGVVESVVDVVARFLLAPVPPLLLVV